MAAVDNPANSARPMIVVSVPIETPNAFSRVGRNGPTHLNAVLAVVLAAVKATSGSVMDAASTSRGSLVAVVVTVGVFASLGQSRPGTVTLKPKKLHVALGPPAWIEAWTTVAQSSSDWRCVQINKASNPKITKNAAFWASDFSRIPASSATTTKPTAPTVANVRIVSREIPAMR
jgi:hypothetical protein